MGTMRIAVRERAWVVLAAVVITEVSLAIGRQSIGPLAPFLQQDLGISRAQVGLFVSAIYLGGIVAVTPSGWLADSLSIRYLLLAGQGIVGAFVIATTTTASFPLALLFLFATGIGYGITAPSTAKAVMKRFAPTTRGTAMSIKQTGVTFGGAMSGALLPVLALTAGWRVAFALAGAAIVTAGLAAFALYQEPPLRDATASAAVAKAPLRTVLFNRDLLLVSGMAAVWATIQVSFATYIVLFLTESLGMAVVAAGGLLAMAQMSGAAGRLVSGIASDRLFGGRRKVVLLLFGGLMVASALGAAALAPGVAAWMLAALVIVFGLAVYGWAGVQMTLVGELAGKERAGTAIGLSLAVSFGGVMVGPPLFGYIVDATHSYPTAWYTLAVAGVVGTALLLLAGEGRRSE